MGSGSVYSSWDPDPLEPQQFGFMDPDPGQVAKYQPKTVKKPFCSQNPKFELLKKGEVIKKFLSLNWS